MKTITVVLIAAVCLTLISLLCSRIEIDATAYGFPLPWLVRVPADTTNLDRSFFFMRWPALIKDFALYLLVSVIGFVGIESGSLGTCTNAASRTTEGSKAK